MIFGSVFTKGDGYNNMNSFKLLQKLPDTTETHKIIKTKVAEIFVKYDVEICEEASLSIELNYNNVKVDEDKSKLFIYQQNSC